MTDTRREEIAVKPLEWDLHENGYWIAETPIGTFEAGWDDGAWAQFDGPSMWEWSSGEDHRLLTEDDAKAACQERYQSIYVSMSTPAPVAGWRDDELAKSLWDEYLRVDEWALQTDEGAHGAKCAIRCIATKLGVYSEFCNLDADAAPGDQPTEQPDDVAVNRFAEAMKAKMAAAREKGRSGWDDPEQCSLEFLASLLIGHVRKGNAGNFEDIANLCMMLHQRGADPSILAATEQPSVKEAARIDREELAQKMGFAARERHDVSENAAIWWHYTGEAKRNKLLKMADVALRSLAQGDK